MTLIDYLRLWIYLPSREAKQFLASNSEKMRWIRNGAVEINGRKANEDSEFEETSRIVIHPNSKHRTTLQ